MLAGCVPWPADLAERYRRDGYWRGEALGELLRRPARLDGSRTAVVMRDRKFSYAELNDWADRISLGMLSLGIKSGDRVVIQLPNVPEFLVVCIALFRIGALPVLALPAYRRNEISYLCQHTEGVAYVIPDVHQRFDHRELARQVRGGLPCLRHVIVVGDAQEFTPLASLAGAAGTTPAEPMPVIDPAEVAFFLLSGGTTGLPKLIPRTHDDYAYQIRATAEAMGFDERGSYLAALPVAHNAALGCPGVLGALWAGGKVLLASSPSPDEVFPLIRQEGATLTTLMPGYLPLWMELAELFDVDLSNLVVEVGGARIAPHIASQVGTNLGCTLTRWFGMAEGPLIFTRLDDDEEVRVLTEGRPLSAADEIRVVDEHGCDVATGALGELLVRGPTTLRGYYRSAEYNAETFTPDGFLRTGDLVRINSAGQLVVEGRAKDVINRGGEKVPPGEVEAHLLAHPNVKEAAVIGVPDRVLGEKSCAVVVPAGDPPTLPVLREFLVCRGMAEYKVPDQLRVVTSLPRTNPGKVDKKALRKLVGSRSQQAQKSRPAETR